MHSNEHQSDELKNGIGTGEYGQIRMPIEQGAFDASHTLTDIEIPEAVRENPDAMARIAEQYDDPAAEYAKLKNQISERLEQPSSGPVFEQRQVDITSFVKAQAVFLEVQTWFLEQRQQPLEGYVQAITSYSKAQRDLIRAQSDLLKQLGVF